MKFFERKQIYPALGIICAIIGLILCLLWPKVSDSMIGSFLKITPTSVIFKYWQAPPLPIYTNFYFFNWTNPEDIYNSSIKPRFEEVGPYSFVEFKEKINIQWNENDTVTYRVNKKYYPVEGSRSLDDNIVSINAVAAAVAHQARNWNYAVQKGISLGLSTIYKNITIKRTAGEFLFQGYNDPILDMVRTLPSFKGLVIPPFDKVGWMYKRNNSGEFEGVYNVATGSNPNERGMMKNWNYKNSTDVFSGYCGMVNGSAGELWPPNLKKDRIITFASDLRRSVVFDFAEEVHIDDILGYKYTAGNKNFDNGSINPDNACFSPGERLPVGLLNLSQAYYGSPVAMSLPHFLYADSIYGNAVEGMHPNKDKHGVYAILEPNTGIPIKTEASMQVNLILRPCKYIRLFENVPDLIFPVVWVEQKFQLDDGFLSFLRLALRTSSIELTIDISILIVGLFMVSVTLLKMRRQKKKKTENTTTIVINNYDSVPRDEEIPKLTPYKDEEI